MLRVISLDHGHVKGQRLNRYAYRSNLIQNQNLKQFIGINAPVLFRMLAYLTASAVYNEHHFVVQCNSATFPTKTLKFTKLRTLIDLELGHTVSGVLSRKQYCKQKSIIPLGLSITIDIFFILFYFFFIKIKKYFRPYKFELYILI